MAKVVAELSANHGTDLHRALAMIREAAACGCDYVKIQTYTPDDMPDKENRELYEKCATPRHWYPFLFEDAKRRGITLFSSVFSPWAIDFLEQFNCPIYKIASPESTRLPLRTYQEIEHRQYLTEKPLWISSGQKDWEQMAGFFPHVLMYCKAGYPATLEAADFDFVAGCRANGFSDHTVGLAAAEQMIEMGVQVIERHFKITDDCIDAAFSSDPDEMRKLCEMAHA